MISHVIATRPIYARSQCPGSRHAKCRKIDAVELVAKLRDIWPYVIVPPPPPFQILCPMCFSLYPVATPKALRTSAHPGLTRALSTRLKLCLDPLIYAFDSPGVMIPFLGRGDRGAERGVKLALIGMSLMYFSYLCWCRLIDPFIPKAGIKEGMYDVEALAAYLVYRLWVLNPHR